MSGMTRTIQQPAGTGSLVATLGGAVAIVAATLAIAWGSANLAKPTTVALPPPVLDTVIDHGSSAGSGLVFSVGYHGFGPRGEQVTDGAGRNLAPRAQ
jgi:hypothetical protein